MAETIEKEVRVQDDFRVLITYKSAKKELKLQLLDGSNVEFDVVRINVKKKEEMQRSALLSAFIQRNNLQGKPASEIMSRLGEITY